MAGNINHLYKALADVEHCTGVLPSSDRAQCTENSPAAEITQSTSIEANQCLSPEALNKGILSDAIKNFFYQDEPQVVELVLNGHKVQITIADKRMQPENESFGSLTYTNPHSKRDEQIQAIWEQLNRKERVEAKVHIIVDYVPTTEISTSYNLRYKFYQSAL